MSPSDQSPLTGVLAVERIFCFLSLLLCILIIIGCLAVAFPVTDQHCDDAGQENEERKDQEQAEHQHEHDQEPDHEQQGADDAASASPVS